MIGSDSRFRVKHENVIGPFLAFVAARFAWFVFVGRDCIYKRVATFARDGSYSRLIRRLDEFRWPEQVELCNKFSRKVYERLKRDWTHLNTATPMDKKDLEKLAESHLLILIDIPNPAQKIGFDRPLGVVPELKERSTIKMLAMLLKTNPGAT